jgi:chromosome segregation ATPase
VITIQSVMLVGLGFLAASLLGLLVASAFWSRAVRLTTARIKQSMPVSEPEIRADRDRLRAEYAIKVHKLEKQLEQAKLERARQHIEINRRDANISNLETDMGQLRVDLEENQNARRVLEQTVTDRLPRVEARLAEAKRLLFNRDREIAELTTGSRRHKQALEEVTSIAAQQTAQIQRLTTATATRSGRRADTQDGEPAGKGELDALRTKTREQAALIDRLQRRLGSSYGLPAPAAARDDVGRAGADALAATAATPAEDDGGRTAYEREIRTLRARADDQSGEIARLKSALDAFEQRGQPARGLRDSKMGLRARLGAAQAQADQRATTIGELRAELAATHERLARQAAHFMDEMRRVGTGGTPNPGRRKRPERERPAPPRLDAQERPESPQAGTAALPAAAEQPAEQPLGNGRADAPAVVPPAAVSAAEMPTPAASAAEMPKQHQIPGERRRARLLDRITGLAKE